MEKNINNFALNKCVASIYTLFNYLEKNKIYLYNNSLSKKVLICLFPIVPRLSKKIYETIFSEDINWTWPIIDPKLLEKNEIVLPIQIKGKLITTINTKKDYDEKNILEDILKIEKISSKLDNKEILKIINVQNKIINIITN